MIRFAKLHCELIFQKRLKLSIFKYFKNQFYLHLISKLNVLDLIHFKRVLDRVLVENKISVPTVI